MGGQLRWSEPIRNWKCFSLFLRNRNTIARLSRP